MGEEGREPPSRQMALQERAATGTSPLRQRVRLSQPAVRGESWAGGTFRDRIVTRSPPKTPEGNFKNRAKAWPLSLNYGSVECPP